MSPALLLVTAYMFKLGMTLLVFKVFWYAHKGADEMAWENDSSEGRPFNELQWGVNTDEIKVSIDERVWQSREGDDSNAISENRTDEWAGGLNIYGVSHSSCKHLS